MPDVPGMDQFANMVFPYVGDILYWTGVSIGSLLCIGVLLLIYHYSTFKIKATVMPLYGSGTDGIFSFGRKKANKIKWTENKTAWKKLFPLFNRKKYEPFDAEYIYPGNQIYVFELGDRWIPGRININKTEDQIRGEINPVPYSVRSWEALQYQKNAQEFAMHNFWEDNKYYIFMMIVIIVCLIAFCVNIWLAYKFATGGVEATEALTNSLKEFGRIPGR